MSRELYLSNNDLTSLETGVFDALTALRYVGEGRAHGWGRAESVMPPHMRACCRGYVSWTCARSVGGGYARAWEPTS